MEVDEIQRQVCKFQRVSSNGSTTTTDNNSSNPQKIATSRGNSDLHNHVNDGGGGGGVGGAGGVTRLCGWPSSRIVRVSRASGGKDRHSKVLTSKGLRDRRVRLSVGTAIQFYDLQDRLGFDQPSKAVEWLLKAASSSIDELPSLDIPVVGAFSDHRIHHQQVSNEKKLMGDGNDIEDRMYQLQHNNNNSYINFTQAKSPSCSSTSETSKGSGLSLSRSETRIKARERAREITVLKKDKEKEKEIDSTRVTVLNQVNSIPENSSFTDLLTGGINANAATATTVRSPMEYFFNRPQQPSPQLFQIPQYNITTGDNLHHFSFDSFLPAVPSAGGTGGGERHNLNFSMTPPPASAGGGVIASGGFTRGTLQSNLQSPLLPHHHHLQRFQSSSIDGSSSANLPFFIVPNATADHFSTTGGYHLGYSGGGDHHKEKSKN